MAPFMARLIEVSFISRAALMMVRIAGVMVGVLAAGLPRFHRRLDYAACQA